MASLGQTIADSAVLKVPRGQHINPFAAVLEKQKRDAALNNQRQAKDASELGDLRKSMIVTDKNLTKPFANKIIDAVEDWYKRADEYTRDGKGDVIPRLIRYRDTVTQPIIMSARSGNTEALKYGEYAADENNLADPTLAGLLRTANSVDEIDTYIKSQNDPYLMSDNQGNFAFFGEKRFGPSKADYLKVDETRDFVVDPKGQRKTYPDAGVVEYTDKFVLNPIRIAQMKSSLLSDPIFNRSVFHSMSPQDRKDPNKFKEAQEQLASQILGTIPSEFYGKPQRMNLPKDASSTRIGFSTDGGTNGRFNVEKTTPNSVQFATTDQNDNIVTKIRVNNGYSIQPIAGSEGSLNKYWASDVAYNIKTGEKENGFDKKGVLEGVVTEWEMEGGGKIKKFNQPMAVISTGTSDNKERYLVKYNPLKGEIKAATVDKKGQNGWELPKDIQKPTEKSNTPKPTFSVSEYNKAKGKKYTIEQVQNAFGTQYNIVP